MDTRKLATDWITYWQLSERERNKEVENVSAELLDGLIHDDPLNALRTMYRIVEMTDDKNVLGALGAGPLEDFLGSDSGEEYAEEIITRARQEKNWRIAFGCVWTGGFRNRDVAQWIENALDLFFPEGRI